MNKRALITESFFIIISLFAITILIVVVHYLQDQIIYAFNQTEIGNNTMAMTSMTNMRSNYQQSLDGAVTVVAGLLVVGSGILALFLPTHPIFMVVAIIGLFPLLFISGILNQVYFAVTNQTLLNQTLIYYANNNMVMQNLPMIALIADIVFIATMFLKGVLR